MNFISFKNWLFERKSENLEYGCLMLYADIPNWKEKISIVGKEDIYEKDDDFGYEKEPHITIVYGFHNDELDKDKMYEEIKEMKPVEVTIEKVGMFESDDYDVVKFDITTTPELKEYRKQFMKYPNTQTYEQYHPHITIAYVKKGEGKKYVQKVKPFKVKLDKAVYSDPDYNKKSFDLKK